MKLLQNGAIGDVSKNVNLLSKISEEYPCFHGAFMMKAIYLKQLNETDFQEDLPGTAVRVNNRSVLYDRVHFPYRNADNTFAAKIVDKQVLEDAADFEIDELVEQATEHAKLPEEESTLSKEERELEELEAKLQDSAFTDMDSLKELVESIRKTQKPKRPVPDFGVETEEEVKKKLNSSRSKFSLEAYQDVDTQKLSPFTLWLQNKKKHEELTTQEKIEEVEKIPFDNSASNEAALLLEVSKSNFKLEDFIVGQIEKKQQKKLNKNSTVRHAISETYAQILIEQGKFEEAIDVFKELSIKYPQKSTTFARQIKNLKNNL